jgi:hypothetical protein
VLLHLALRTWVFRSHASRNSLLLLLSPCCCIGLSRPGSQDLGFRTQTDARNASYGRLIFFPSFFSASIVTFLFPVR